jgi:hypothetical protein
MAVQDTIGVGISRDTLDIRRLSDRRHERFGNDKAGLAARWRDLEPDAGILAALEHAGPRPAPYAGQNAKRRWSERFADGCAVAFAAAFRRTPLVGKTIRPMSVEDGAEPLIPLGGATRKRIDVTVVDPMMGLEIGVSLKGLNFRDSGSNNFDKDLTGLPGRSRRWRRKRSPAA